MSEELLKEIIERLDRLEAKCDVLNSRQFNSETDIHMFKENFKSLFEIAGEHEVKIRTLTRRPV